MVVYCDSVVLIYYLDFTGTYNKRAVSRLATLRAGGDLIGFSNLTRLECRVRPIQSGDTALLAKWDTFFTQPDMHFVPINETAYDKATHIRAAHNFKSPDAIHLAAAVEAGCGLFLTNDAKLLRCTDIAVELLP